MVFFLLADPRSVPSLSRWTGSRTVPCRRGYPKTRCHCEVPVITMPSPHETLMALWQRMSGRNPLFPEPFDLVTPAPMFDPTGPPRAVMPDAIIGSTKKKKKEKKIQPNILTIPFENEATSEPGPVQGFLLLKGSVVGRETMFDRYRIHINKVELNRIARFYTQA